MKTLSDFIVFSDDWGRHPSSCQHLIKRFLPFNKVLWVNSVGLRTPTLSWYDLKRGFQKIKEWGHQPQEVVEPHLKRVSPFSLPWNQFGAIRSINKYLGCSILNKSIRAEGFKKTISLSTVPNACDWMGNLGESLKVYYCVDDFSQWPGMNRETILEMEKVLLSKIDLFVATSENLMQTKRPENIPALLLPHGVDLDHFKQASKQIDQEKRECAFPTIAYFGMLDERLDFDLIDFLVKQRPQWNWLFLGPHQFFPKELSQKKNIFIRPSVEYDELPHALRAVDLLCLPYKTSLLSQSLNPLKLRECLATGKPIVSTPLPEIEKYSEVLFIGKSPEEILQHLEDVIQNFDQWNSQKQVEAIASETWEARADLLAEKIEDLL